MMSGGCDGQLWDGRCGGETFCAVCGVSRGIGWFNKSY